MSQERNTKRKMNPQKESRTATSLQCRQANALEEQIVILKAIYPLNDLERDRKTEF